jgi:hypothetical protein
MFWPRGQGPRSFLSIALCVALALGAWLRFDQLASQVPVEDEWHLIHQVTYYGARHILMTFGNADYGIPLALMYLLEANTIGGVSELDLRLPMAIAGTATVILVPLMLRRRFEDRTLALFALLLAASPFLISYSRMVRTYALIVFGIYVAYWLFERATRGDRVSWLAGSGYAIVSGLVLWTHLLTGPMLAAPLIWEWAGRLRCRSGIRTLVFLTALTGALMALAVLPPLMSDPAALSSKTGRDSIGWDTVVGSWYFFMGTGSDLVAGITAVLAAVGLAQTLKAAPMIRWIWTGAVLTVGALFVLKPWWVDHSIAFGRYLLPLLPALLLAVAVGVMRVVSVTDAFFERRVGPRMHWVAASGLVILLLGWFVTMPTLEILVRPNSYSLHPYFQMEYRKDRNLVYMAFRRSPVTQFWWDLSKRPRGTVTVAAAPFNYTTYLWPAPLWEEVSGQRVIPAFLWGSCVGPRHGEIPPDRRFRFRNGVHFGDPASWKSHGVDYIVYLKAVAEKDCEAWAREHFGPPTSEDSQLVVWKVSPKP